MIFDNVKRKIFVAIETYQKVLQQCGLFMWSLFIKCERLS